MYKLLVILIFTMFTSCSQSALKFFFDGVEETSVPESKPGEVHDSNQSLQTQPDSIEQENHDQAVNIISVHPAYRRKQCKKCHDVNHSNRLLTRQPELCYNCHKPFAQIYPVLHGPVAAGYCTACHKPHQSGNDKLLRLPVREICQYCHRTGDVRKNKAHQKQGSENCMTCHNSHGGKTFNLLRE